MCDLVGNPEDRFSHNEAQICVLKNILHKNINGIAAAYGHYDKTLPFLSAMLHDLKVKD